MPGFLSGGLTILVCSEASTLSDSVRKMFLLCLFADFIWRNGLETFKKITVLKEDICKHVSSMLNVWSGMFFITTGVSYLINGKRREIPSCLLNASCSDVITVPLFFLLPPKLRPAP